MFFIPKLLFNDNANEGGTGGENQPATTATTTDNAPVIPDDIQKELNELRAFKQSISDKESKTPEQLQKEADAEKAAFIKFSSDNDLMKVDDFTKYESTKQRQDRELVFDSFAKEWKEENPDASDEDVKDAFDNLYHLNSDNEKVRTRGEKLISKEAKELRSPLETSYNTAQEKFKQNKSLQQEYPNFQKYLTSTIESSIPEKLKVGERKIDDDENVAIEVDLSKDERKEIFDNVHKELSKPEIYLAWKNQTKNGKNDFIEKLIEKETKYLINEKKQQVIFEKTAQDFYDKGKAKGGQNGSNVGARNPFPVVKNIGTPTEKTKGNAQENVQKSDVELRQKVQNRRAS